MNNQQTFRFIVAKFGGTSMGDAQAIRQSVQLALKEKAQLMVVSATAGTTNQLVELTQLTPTATWAQCKSSLFSIKEKHLKIAAALEAKEETFAAIEKICTELEALIRGVNLLKECSPRATDGILSIGERLSAILAYTALKQISTRPIHHLDAREMLKTDNDFGKARPLLAPIFDSCQKILATYSPESLFVTEGYIGQTLEGHNTTLGRGGSDYSAALLAEGFGADLLQIWTDVPGIATTDPRIVKNAKIIPEITFSEASEMAIFGAKILHPTTLRPALRSNMSVFVGSTFHPEKGGTWIKHETPHTPLVRALATRPGQVLLTLTNPEMLEAHGFLARFFEIFSKYKISVDSISTSEISVALTLNKADAENQGLFHDLSQMGEIHVDKNLTLVSIIGNGINHQKGLAAEIFSQLKDINVRMICQGASRHNICFLIQEEQVSLALHRLHEHFIKS